jgi:hypothetical protein
VKAVLQRNATLRKLEYGRVDSGNVYQIVKNYNLPLEDSRTVTENGMQALNELLGKYKKE